MYNLGVDLGGTNIAVGVVNENYEIVGRGKMKTRAPRPAEEIVADIVVACEMAVKDAGITMADIASVGIGSVCICINCSVTSGTWLAVSFGGAESVVPQPARNSAITIIQTQMRKLRLILSFFTTRSSLKFYFLIHTSPRAQLLCTFPWPHQW